MAPALCQGVTIRNPVKGTKTKTTHMCTECKRTPTASCFAKFHVASCEVCGEKFNVMTRGGCSAHEYCDGFNQRFVNLRRGLDPDFKSTWELEQEAKARAEEEAKAAQEAEERAQELANRDPCTDWHKKPREKTQKEKTNARQGKKQPLMQDLKCYKRGRKNGDA